MEFPDDVAKRLPDEFEFKSQRKGFKRFSNPQTMEMFQELQAAEDGREQSLKNIMSRIFAAFDDRYAEWKQVVDSMAVFDVLISFVQYTKSISGGNCCKPSVQLSEKPFIEIVDGVHPFADRIFTGGDFIPNDIHLGHSCSDWTSDGRIILLTGPNMGGKSTLMRQVSLIVVLAQMGCYVPASKCSITPVDRLFTRLGAKDNIAAGESTFFVELQECSSILRHASPHSLILMDELGRGTSTHDGTAIATAVLRHIANDIGCRTLFSTHYHSMVDMVRECHGIALGHMACMVENENFDDPSRENVTFLYKLVPGACPKSYGFHAAKLAGLPVEIIKCGYEKSSIFEKTQNHRLLYREIAKQCAADTGQPAIPLRQLLTSLRL